MIYTFTALEKEKLEKLKAAEADLDMTLIALDAVSLKAAQLNEQRVAKIKELEQQLGVLLVAVDT